jgi:glycosyltransferase involved in cell wall biosynthesis
MSQQRKINVTWVTTGLGSGGAEMMLCALIAASDTARFRHTVIALTAGGKYVAQLEGLGVGVASLDMKPGRPGLIALFKLARAVRRSAPDVLMGWMYHGNLAALLGRWLAFRRIPVIAGVRQSLDSLANEKRGSAMVIRLLAKLSSRFEAIVYNSQRSAGQHEALGYDKSKSVLIPNGVNTGAFAPSPDARSLIRAELGVPDGTLLVGRIGRNHPMKDHATFLDAAGLVALEMPEVHFILAGTGMEPSDPGLARRAARTDLSGRVHLLGERHDLPQLTAALDVACSSSAFGEGFPNVIAEAMASAVPCVATDIGDSAFVLGPDGSIVPPRDARLLADALLRLLRLPPDHRSQLGQSLRRRALGNFSLESALRRFEDLFMRGAPAPASNPKAKTCVA